MVMGSFKAVNSTSIKEMGINSYKDGGFLFFVSAFIALFMPSSIGGVIIPGLSIVAVIAASVFLLFNLYRSPLNIHNFTLCAVFFVLLLLFTMLSRKGEFTPGAIFPYLGMWVVLITCPPNYVSSISRNVFHIMACVLVIFGFGVVFGNEAIRELIFDFYQAYNDDLHYFMVQVGGKPVGTFATHSLSAFMYCLFAVVYFRLYLYNRGLKSLLFLMMCLSFFFMIVSLKSFSAIALSVILVGLYLYHLLASFKVVKLFLIVLIALAVLTFVDATFFYESVDAILSSNGNGIKGRMVSGNRLEGTYKYILENPFLPLGLTSLPDVMFGDNFIADYVIRVGVFGYLIVLLAAYLYFRKSFSSRIVVLFCMGFVLLGDLGYPLLTNYRSVFLIPVFVAMWRCPVRGFGTPNQISTR